MSPKPAPAGGAAVDALLEPAFLENATRSSMTEVRLLRRKAEQEEVNLSYTRRLLQGRLDIVRRELQRRAEHDGRSLVDLLPEILSEKGRGPAHGLGRHQTVQPHAPEEYESWVNSLTGGVDCPAIADLSDAKLEKVARALADAESGLSERRRGVQQVMDALAAELGRRYRDGEADVAALLADEGGTERRWPDNPVLVEVWRSGFLESVHRGALVVLDADGSVPVRGRVPSTGRSCRGRRTSRCRRPHCSPRAGRPARGEELAIGAGSHNGEDGHRDWSPAMLAAAGLGPDDLGCPPALPQHEPTKAAWLVDGRAPDRLAMNCSGKHAAMLSACVASGWPTAGYLERDHPLQQAIEARLGEAAGEPVHGGGGRRVRGAAARAVPDRPGPRRAVAGRRRPRAVAGAFGRRRHAGAPLVRGRHRPGGHRPDDGRSRAAGQGRGRRRARGGTAGRRCGRAQARRRRRPRAHPGAERGRCSTSASPPSVLASVVADPGQSVGTAWSARCAPPPFWPR